eukprot:symbB.v1.2.027304.t1/scaffold2790.1/size70228/9
MGDLPETLLKLSAVREQQVASLQSLEHLTQQHRDWHQALDDLFEEVDKALKSKEKLAEKKWTAAPLAPPIASTDGQDQGSQGQGHGEVASELAMSDFSNFDTKGVIENVPVDPPEFSESNKRATRSMSSNSLLRSRTTLAQDFPQGPLRKVVVEVMADDIPQVFADTWWAKAQNLAAEVVRSRWFEFTAGFVILLRLGLSGSKLNVNHQFAGVYRNKGHFEPFFLKNVTGIG